MAATAQAQPHRRPDKWFYASLAGLVALVVAYGFSQTLSQNLLRAAIARPVILWIHGSVFFGWVALFIVQIALVRTRHVRWHRTLGLAGMMLGATMPVIGVATSLRMMRFDVDHGISDAVDSAAFLSIPFNDMIFFSGAVAAAFWWRRRPDVHRRMALLATCLLTAAAFARFPFIRIVALRWYAGVDILLALAVAQDMRVSGRLHRAYAISLPLVLGGQVTAMWLYLARPSWWVGFAGRLF